LIVAVVLVAGALVYFGFSAFKGSTVYYYTVSELQGKRAELEGKSIRVSGKLLSETFSREPGATLAVFTLTDGANTVRARYDGVVPDLFFNEYSDIVLNGRYTAAGEFEADNVIVKCPSKYVAAAQAEDQSKTQ
jgi:cytochrome c-type biogenesis protein CcmE